MKIISPIYLILPRKTKKDRKCALNLNAFRNRKFFLSNDLKIMYKEIMEKQLDGQVFKTPIHITYTLYWAYKSDLMNVVSIVDKFFCDALVEYNCIPDDNINYLVSINSKVGGKDKLDPRMEIEITEL